MKKRDSFMTPISTFFMLITATPYIGMKFGHLSLLLVSPFLLYSIFNSYQFYKNRASQKNISYTKALEEDLPDMSPIHFIFFLIITAPIILMITGYEIKNFIGIAIAWTIYAIYYYGFREK